MSEAVERDRLDVDILFVGAGPATLASAIRLVDLCKEKGIEPPSMLVIEKAAELGEHQLSGAVMKPTAIEELVPDYREKGFPFHYECTKDAVYFLTAPETRRPAGKHGDGHPSGDQGARQSQGLILRSADDGVKPRDDHEHPRQPRAC